MDYWLIFGVWLTGCGVGALLTAAFYSAQLHRIKTDLRVPFRASLDTLQVASKFEGPSNLKRRGHQRRSA
jgi:hypothetical protein